MALLAKDEVQQVVAQWVSRQQTADCTIAIEGPLFDSGLSSVYRMSWGGAPFPIAIKVFAQGQESGRLFKALQNASELLDEASDFTVPRAVGHLPQHNIVLMEWIDGSTIASLIKRPGCTTEQASTYLNRAGEWLGRLHSARIFDDRPLELDYLIERVDELSHQLPQQGVRGTVASRALNKLRLSASAVAGVPVVRCWSHGDFKPMNILVSGRKTVGMDLESVSSSPSIEDIAHFLNHLYARVYYVPLSWVKPRRVTVLEESFLTGYQTRMPMPPELPLNWLRVLSAIRMWAQIERTGSSLLRSLYAYDLCGALLEYLARSLGER
jgi:Ser/Thr protein kinase RdoA (MazF antagonist)